MCRVAATGGGVHVVIYSDRRCDTGVRLDSVKAVVRLAVDLREFGPNFSSWLTGFVAKWDSAARELAAR
jgi:UTP--glucose-1-phosphate uridylyltransferase